MPARAVHPSYPIHVAGYNLGLIMRLLTGAGTPRGFQTRVSASLAAVATPDAGLAVILIVVAGDQTAAVAVSSEVDHSN
jgi:transposase